MNGLYHSLYGGLLEITSAVTSTSSNSFIKHYLLIRPLEQSNRLVLHIGMCVHFLHATDCNLLELQNSAGFQPLREPLHNLI